MDCNMPGLPVHHQLPEFTQTHVHWVSDVIQQSHLLSSPSPPAFNLSQHQVFSNESVLPIGGQSTRISASALVLPTNTEDWFPLGWTGWISLQFKVLSRVFSNTTVQKHSILQHSAFFTVQLSHPYMTTGKTIALIRQTFVGKVMSPIFNVLSRLVITFLPRRKRLLISWLCHHFQLFWSPPSKVCHCFHCFSIYLPWSYARYHDLRVFWKLSFKPTFSLSSFTFIRRLFRSSSLSAIRVVWSAYLRLLLFLLAILIPACASSSPEFPHDFSQPPGNLDSSLCFIQPRVSSWFFSANSGEGNFQHEY